MSRGDFLEYEKTVDAWRHQRMMKPCLPFASVGSWNWLTVGDTHGWDAARLTAMGAADVTASDLAEGMLEHAKNEGIIQAYLCENAESMKAKDNAYDVVFCKEAFHHLPRPWIGLYEMLRVARKVVLLVEPRDWIVDRGPVVTRGPKALVSGILKWTKMRLGQRLDCLPVQARFQLGDKPGYEEVGNYIFSVSSREIEKVALGMDFPAVGFFALNDHFEKGLGNFRAEDSDAEFVRVRKILEAADLLTEAGLGSSSLLLAALFKEMPKPDLEKNLTDIGWHIKKLDRNPYLQRDRKELRN